MWDVARNNRLRGNRDANKNIKMMYKKEGYLCNYLTYCHYHSKESRPASSAKYLE